MGAELPWADLGLLLLALSLAGVVTGFMAGVLGIGGGAILVPVLHEVFGIVGVDASVRMQLAIGTSMAIIVPTTIRTLRAHLAREAVDRELVRSLIVPCLIGVGIGVVTGGWVGATGLKLFWIVCASLLSLKFFIGQRDWRIGETIPGPPFIWLFGVVVGFISAMMSVAGGVYVTALMTLYGRPIHRAIATGTGIGPAISIAGTLGFIWAGWGVKGLPLSSFGYVNLIGALIVAVASVLSAPLGVRIAYGLEPRTLELAFAGFLALAGLRFLVGLVV